VLRDRGCIKVGQRSVKRRERGEGRADSKRDRREVLEKREAMMIVSLPNPDEAALCSCGSTM